MNDYSIVDEIIARYGGDPESLLAVLQDLQTEFNYLPEKALEIISEKTGVPLSRISSMATFYSSLSLKERGKNVVCVCTGTACHVRGSQTILGEFEKGLGIKTGNTDSVKEFTLEKVNCVGACALGPLVVINGNYHGNLKPGEAVKIIEQYRNKGRNDSE